jgi:thiamine-monophosphate kinase
MSEHGWIARLGATLGPSSPRVLLGIGDDAAVVGAGVDPLVLTVDASVEGVHFTREIVDLEGAGYRAFMAALSDLAAMGARPVAALSSLTIPGYGSESDLDDLTRGQAAAAAALGVPIVGGNLSRGPCWSIHTTAIGEAALPVRRSGARPGDLLWLAGPVGLAAVGLRALLGKRPASASLDPGVAAWRRPLARIADGLRLPGRASAAIDISDGLAQDAGHVAESSGACLVLDADLVLGAGGEALLAGAAALGLDPLAMALGGGEDYALLVAAAEAPGPAFVRVGAVVEGAGVRVERGGIRLALPGGFDHLG